MKKSQAASRILWKYEHGGKITKVEGRILLEAIIDTKQRLRIDYRPDDTEILATLHKYENS